MSRNTFRGMAAGRSLFCALLVLVLTACGSGSSSEPAAGSASDPAPVDPAPAPPAPPPPDTNTAPVITNEPALTAKAGTAYSFMPNVTDADGDTMTFAITGKPAWASFNASTGALTGTPADGNVGLSGDIEVTASDGKAQDSIGPFRINVAARGTTPPATNKAPTISGTPATTGTAGAAYLFIPTASDADNDALTFSISNRPQWAAFNTTSGQLSGTPTAAGTAANIRISVSDGKASTALAAFTITVAGPPNQAPVISGTPATSVVAGAAYSFQPAATDADANTTFVWSIQNKPTWATFSTTTGKLSGTAGSAGSYANIRITVSDGKANVSLPVFAIQVTAAANRAPTISGTPATSVAVNAVYSFTPTASDADQDMLSFSVQNKPSWATFSISNGKLSGTPTSSGSFSGIVISVSDGKASAALPAFTITVAAGAPSNGTPTISGSPTTSVVAGSAYSFTPTASDPEGSTLTFSIQNKPTWATFNTGNGKLSGTPAAGNVGTTSNIVISVSDGAKSASLGAFAIAVTAAPTTTGSVTLNWTPPTQNTDGTSLTNLAGYRIYAGTSASNLTQAAEIANPGVTSYLVENLTSGTWYFSVHVYNADGSESSPSNPVSKTIQ